MNSFVLIFVPGETEPADIESVFCKRVGRAEPVDNQTANHSETIDDAEQLPLWRWFTF